MSIFDRIKGHVSAQFLDVISWTTDATDVVAWRFPVFNKAIQDGGQLVVREGQVAVFVQEGTLSDVFGPGTYEISTNTPAIMGFLDAIAYNFNYPYKGDIYFFSTKKFAANGWGTKNPIIYNAEGFGALEVRAFGHYDFKLTDPAVFLREVVSTSGEVRLGELVTKLRSKLASAFGDMLNESGLPLVKLYGHLDELSEAMMASRADAFSADFGLSLTDFIVESISLPDEVQKSFREAQSMRMVGAGDYTQFQAAKAIRGSASGGGGGNSMMDAGVGMAMGQMLAGQMAGTAASPAGSSVSAASPPPPPSEKTFHYNGVGGEGQFTAQHIATLIVANRGGAHNIWSAGWSGWKPWAEVSEVAAMVPPPPPPTDEEQPPPPPPIGGNDKK
jgi:membrane protease subunit (stomatin/prohibitin family)